MHQYSATNLPQSVPQALQHPSTTLTSLLIPASNISRQTTILDSEKLVSLALRRSHAFSSPIRRTELSSHWTISSISSLSLCISHGNRVCDCSCSYPAVFEIDRQVSYLNLREQAILTTAAVYQRQHLQALPHPCFLWAVVFMRWSERSRDGPLRCFRIQWRVIWYLRKRNVVPNQKVKAPRLTSVPASPRWINVSGTNLTKTIKAWIGSESTTTVDYCCNTGLFSLSLGPKKMRGPAFLKVLRNLDLRMLYSTSTNWQSDEWYSCACSYQLLQQFSAPII